MNSQDLSSISHRARRETEAFINNYINDHAKGWPILAHCDSVSIGYRRDQHIRRRDMIQIIKEK